MSKPILVVDDDQITLELVKHILEEIVVGKVETFSSSMQAMKWIQQREADSIALVVCDRHMPEYSGIDVLHTLRLKSAKTPFLMVTGDATKNAVVEAVRAGATEFIAKPFKNADLAKKVQRLIAAEQTNQDQTTE